MIAPYSPPRTPWARLKRKAVGAFAPHRRHLALTRGVVSFTFDDAPHSAIANGASLLDAHGLRGTYFLCCGLTGAVTHLGPMHTSQDIERLLHKGHEIGCHTASHLDCARATRGLVERECDSNALAFADFGAPALDSFAYPFGETTFSLKHSIVERFSSARGIEGGLNVDRLDIAQLKAQRLYGEATFAAVSRLLHEARDRCGWAIVFTHDVCERPSAYGCTPALLQRAIALAATLDLDVAPIREVLNPRDGAS